MACRNREIGEQTTIVLYLHPMHRTTVLRRDPSHSPHGSKSRLLEYGSPHLTLRGKSYRSQQAPGGLQENV